MGSSKKYLNALSKVDKHKSYFLKDAVTLLKEVSYAKFDESVEFCMRLNIEQKHSIRGSIALPHGIAGQEFKVLVFATGEQVKEATDAGADFVGFEELFEKIKSGWTDFDVAIAHPDLMREISKLGPILGRKGLMPNPKVGTVSTNIKDTVVEFKKGRTEYRADKTGIVHLKVAKLSMDIQHIEENFNAIFQELLRCKPSDIKGEYVKSVFISSTMGPGIKIDVQSLK